MNSILRRRSIRFYKQKAISDDLITQLLEAAMSAPSAQNQRPWQFIVITDKVTLNSLGDVSPYAHMIRNAPLAILICGDLEQEISKGFWVQDCSAATENILIAVEELHLGAVWLGIYPREARVEFLREILGIPLHIVPFALIPVGYPAEKKETSRRYDASRVHYNSW